ncbi:bifunctional riboflavin kinase/FAD synthetase [Clostridium sp.]|uniref:bifunctional riboflavin kinase/FAD synthetase n=1 Tax=Clostridium sp. TaxID=1506 RepID=UPI003F368A5F
MIVLNDIIIKDKHKDNYVALGSFDGLHLGHLSLIKKVVEMAREKNANSMVFTYINHPRALINKDLAPKLIMDLQSKIQCLEKEKIDVVALRNFTQEFMKMSPEDFIKLLCEDYNVKGIVVGFNFRFGHKNQGDVHLLEKLKNKYNYELHVMEPYKYKEDIISSTRVRGSIQEGKVSEAFEMLSRPFMIRGKVTHGKKLGRTIGFPTANLSFNEDVIIPKIGVYYTNVAWNGKLFKGITSVGNNPTVNGQQLTIETYILDFNSMIYDEEIEVYFIERIRDEKKFNSLDELVNQLFKDKEFALENKKIMLNN